MWNKCGMARNEKGLKELLARIPALREEFWRNVTVPGGPDELNQPLVRAGRVADFLEFAEMLVLDALERRESVGAHFRDEFKTPEGEPLRDDANFLHVAAWEYKGAGVAPVLHKEPLAFERIHLAARSYK